jgi:hypothetical protein
MTKFSWIVAILLAIGLANGFASAALAGHHTNSSHHGDQGEDNDDQGEDNGDQ